MCGIFAAFNLTDFQTLAKANAYRGQASYSITTLMFNVKRDKVTPAIGMTKKGLGKFSTVGVPPAPFYIGHIQAPTSQAPSYETIHPAQWNNRMLWHNGIIKEHDCDRLRQKQNSKELWDTMLLLKEVNICANLNEINGSFACLYWHEGLYVFRNLLAPMHIGDGCLSSVPTSLTPTRLKAERYYEIDFNHDVSKLHLVEIDRFITKENPYEGIEDDE